MKPVHNKLSGGLHYNVFEHINVTHIVLGYQESRDSVAKLFGYLRWCVSY